MLFNSPEFLFQFLPIVLLGFYVFSRVGRAWATTWLALASLYFYADWKLEYLWIILASILGNYAVGRVVSPSANGAPGSRRRLLALGITLNLLALGYYKYTDFILENLAVAAGSEWTLPGIVLPLAISFFTFQQIAFLVDSYRGNCSEFSFSSYCLFVTFFPQLIAGPIVHHSEMLPQFDEGETSRPSADRFVIGLTILGIGLFKKVVIADNVAPYSTGVFALADAGHSVSMIQAWTGALAYTVQIYFDFSGYSDMAIGAARLFGIRLPVNFFSPYKSGNIIEFWRRWHMTLSRFLRDYIYIALGGNRKGATRRYGNLMATMVLGGIWHGAGWNFLIWGTLHGGYLVVNHGWRSFVRTRLSEAMLSSVVYRMSAWSLTFIAVVVGWVFFRAETLGGAMRMLSGMINGSPEQLPTAALGLTEVGVFLLVILGTLFLPNSLEVMRDANPVVNMPAGASSDFDIKVRWRPHPLWALGAGAATAFALLHLGQVSEFLYFQF